jgi:predicted NUDIX family NTP pyrophosphohydrolase
MKESAGTLLYRSNAGQLEILIVHPSGNYNRRAPWSIPKGLPDAGESLEDAARRETREETGVEAGELTLLGEITYTKSRKRVHAFAGIPASGKPHPTSWEVDRAEFVAIDRAEEWLHPDQRPLVAMLRNHLANVQRDQQSS